MNNLIMVGMALLSLFFDTVFFTRLNIYGIRPDVLMASVVCCAILQGSVPGAIMGAATGFVVDLLFGNSLGMNACLYMIAGYAAGIFHEKFYASNALVPAVTAGVGSMAKELIIGIILIIERKDMNLFIMFPRFIVPIALMTAGVCALWHILFRRLFESQTKRKRRGM